MWVGFLYMAVVSDVFVVWFSLQTLRDTRTSRKGREKSCSFSIVKGKGTGQRVQAHIV